MAALLRSARLLKFSPSGVLQVTCTKRNGPSLGRLYSGHLGGRRTGVCARQITPLTENASSRVWPYAVGFVRNFAVATEQKDEGKLMVHTKQMQQFEWALSKLDSSVRKTGRITKTLLLKVFHDLCRSGYPSSNQALLLLRSCGSLLPEVPMEERTELAHHVWEKLKKLGVQYDASHYNALLKVYLQNEFKFSPTDFLAKMEEANVQLNRVTYQRLIAAYCQNGDIEGASTILSHMKSKDLSITEAVFSSLVTGHARAGDIESAKNILPVMRGAGIEPGSETYVALLDVYAEKGDLDSINATLEAAESAECSLMDRDIMQVIFTLAKCGHQQHIPEMVKRLRHERGYIPDAMNLCLTLITEGKEDTAFHILTTFPSLQSDRLSDNLSLGNFFLRHCININMSVEKIVQYCKELQEKKMHTSPFTFILYCALEAKKTDLSIELMKILKKENLPIRPHYFWPLLTWHIKENNIAGVCEVMKALQQLDVSPDVETLSSYILPVFPSIEAARETFKESGISVESEAYLLSEIRLMAVTDMARLYNMLSDPSLPSVDLNAFRNAFSRGFRNSTDVDNIVKVIELLYKDERFFKENTVPAEATGHFLYSLIDGMSAGQVVAQKHKLQNLFSQLRSKNIKFSVHICRGIRNLLDSFNVPEVVECVMALVDHKDSIFSGPMSATPRVIGGEGNVVALEKKLAGLKAANKPLGFVFKQTLHALYAEQNLQRALELKQQYEEYMTASCYAILISLCCNQNNVEEALNLKRELNCKDSSLTLDPNKYIILVKTLSLNGRTEEAVDILKEMKEKEVVMNSTYSASLFHMLNALAVTGDVSSIQRLQDTLFTLGLAMPTSNLCSPLVTAYLTRKDVAGAFEAAVAFLKRYNFLPRLHDIIVALVENGDTELLQKVMDLVNQERGEMTMLYDLFFAFLQTGRNREARKVIETPGLRAKPGRLQWYAEKCILNNQIENLEQMVDMTAKLFECDRDEMYNYLLRLCNETNNWQKAEAVWTKMQEENVIPRERTLRVLADILKKNGKEVPFTVPESWYQKDAIPIAVESDRDNHSRDYVALILTLCKRGKTRDALWKLKEADRKGVVLAPSSYDHLIRALLAEGSIEDAMVVKDIATSCIPGFQLSEVATNLLIITHSKKDQVEEALEKLRSMNHVPSQLAITRLIQGLSNRGDVAGIQEVESIIKRFGLTPNMSRIVFVTNTALAHIRNGDTDSAVELLEEIYTNPDHKTCNMSFVYRKVLEDGNDHALDKLSAMAERLANHFACYKPATELFLQLLDKDKVEDAKFMLARCSAVAEQKRMLLSFVTQKAQIPGQVGKLKILLSLIPDITSKDVLYSYLIKCHAMDKDLPAAKALHEQIQKEGMVLSELSLKRLAVLYREAGETVPFPEPPESFKFYADKLKATCVQVTAET